MKAFSVSLGLLFVLLCSCNSEPSALGTFKVLPSPQEFVVTSASAIDANGKISALGRDGLEIPTGVAAVFTKADKASEAQLSFEINPELEVRDQGYTLDIDSDHISIVGKDQQGLFYGFKTLEQLLEDARQQEVTLPICHIKDFPELTYRSVHLDVKHHTEKFDYYYDLMDKLASYKVNAIILEVEDKLGYERQPLVASDDAFSKADWLKLSEYAQDRHIAISPLIQGLGHASFVLKHAEYEHLRDNPDSDWAFNPLDPETYKVQYDLYDDALEAFPHGEYLHVGGDEVHTTGRESGQEALALQMRWLDSVSAYAKEHNRTPIFWDDMPLKLADLYVPTYKDIFSQKEVDSIWEVNEPKLAKFLDRMPKNCVYMRWNYKEPTSPGNLKAMNWYIENGLSVIGATAGQTRWVLMPQDEGNLHNIRSFALNSIENKLHGLLLTLWDDDSPHFELYSRGIVGFSEFTWSGDKRSVEEVKSVYRHREFGNASADQSFAFIDSLEAPVASWKNALLEGNKRNYLMRSPKAKEKAVIEMPFLEAPGAWSAQYESRLKQAKGMVARTDSIAAKIEALEAVAVNNKYALEVYSQVNTLTNFTFNMLLDLEAYDKAQDDSERQRALAKLKTLKKEFESMRKEFETVYGKTRVLNKPSNYILDQDHHVHLANQSLNFDWQFYAEMLFLEKLDEALTSLEGQGIKS